MAKSNMDQDILKVLLSEEEIKARVQEMGDQLYEAFKDKNPMFVGVLNGCFIFMADLVRAAQLKSELEFIGVSSYKNATKSSGVVQITRDLQRDISGRDIIIVEDILDSGNTLAFLKNYLMTKGAASITIATLLDKPARREKTNHRRLRRLRRPRRVCGGLRPGLLPAVPQYALYRRPQARGLQQITPLAPILRCVGLTYTKYACAAAPLVHLRRGGGLCPHQTPRSGVIPSQ